MARRPAAARLATLLALSAAAGCGPDAPPPPSDLTVVVDLSPPPPDLAVPPDLVPPPPPPPDFKVIAPDLYDYGDLLAPGDFAGETFPAAHPPMPQLGNQGGRLLRIPRMVMVTFSGDKLADALDQFVEYVPSSPWWKAALTEYGVGAGTAAPPVHLDEKAAARLDDAQDIQPWLKGKLDGTHPEFGVPDDNTLYIIAYPLTTQITYAGQMGCAQFAGYHGSIQLGGGQRVAYAVLPRCEVGTGQGTLDSLTGPMAHEIAEAATDADPQGPSAFHGVAAPNGGWEVATGTEVGDLCFFMSSPFYRAQQFDYMVARTWSNAAARASHDPCVPSAEGQSYFSAAPVLTDTIHLGQNAVPGMKLALGEQATIELDLFSDGPTLPWTVGADSSLTQLGQTSEQLSFKLDRTTGANGDKLHLTVTVVKTGPNNVETFAITSSLGPITNLWFVTVADK